jgi:hypothetical protein
MDLQTAMRLSGQNWQLARIAAVVFLIVAGGLLTSSLLDPTSMSSAEKSAPSRKLR